MGPRKVKAPTGSTLTCKGWLQEAAYRMIQNNLDPGVAENPDELIVYGGFGKAARNWESFDKILRSLISLNDDETLMVQSGKPVGIFKTHRDAPRVRTTACLPPRQSGSHRVTGRLCRSGTGSLQPGLCFPPGGS